MRRLMTCVRRTIMTIYSEDSGGIAISFALVLVVLLGFAGAAVDYSRAISVRSKAQAALDAAVLAGASATASGELYSGVDGGVSGTDRIKKAKAYLSANARKLKLLSSEFHMNGEVVVGNAMVGHDVVILKILGLKRFNLPIHSEATAGHSRAPLCFLAMHPTRKHTLELKGKVSVVAPDCHIYGNSNNEDDVVDPHSIENVLISNSIQAVGFGHHFLENVTPPLEHAPGVIADPLASLPIPAATPCTFTKVTISGGARTLLPGVYCGGLTIEKNANVTLKPGLFVIAGGPFKLDGAQVLGSSVTLGLADSKATLSWKAATVRLSAPTGGVYAGIAIVGARVTTQHIIESSTIDIHGVTYLPKGAIDWKNTGTPSYTAKWTAWIIDGVSWDGDGKIGYPFDLSASSVPYPKQLWVVPRNGAPHIVN